jgi:flavin-dependent thymidylate synthase
MKYEPGVVWLDGKQGLCDNDWHQLTTKAVQKWADPAMVPAQPVDAAAGPRVYLLSMTPDPLGTIAATCQMYIGQVVTDLSKVDDEQRRYYLAQVLRTRLRAPFEFVNFHFMIEGVTRAFTHQMVRQRTAVYAQESLRFAVKGLDQEDGLIPTSLPPSLASLPEGDPARQVWAKAIGDADVSYHALVSAGVPAEDARGLLPHATLTRLHYGTNLRALLDHAGNRLCTQAQFEWRLVFSRIAEAIRNYPSSPGVKWNGLPTWQYAALADLFRPVCYTTGKCEFNSDMDRPCSIRDRVIDRAKHGGTDSTHWTKPFLYDSYGDDGRPIVVTSPGIQPAEWLADPTAARRG